MSRSISRQWICPRRWISSPCADDSGGQSHGTARHHQAGRRERARFVEFMKARLNVWSMVGCPERLSVNGAGALLGGQNACRDTSCRLVPFAPCPGRGIPPRVLWGTDRPHPNLNDPMPDDGLLADFIVHSAVTQELQYRLPVAAPMRLYRPEETRQGMPQCTVSNRYSSPSSPCDMMV